MELADTVPASQRVMAVQEATVLFRAVNDHMRCGGLLSRASLPSITAEAVSGILMQHLRQMG